MFRHGLTLPLVLAEIPMGVGLAIAELTINLLTDGGGLAFAVADDPMSLEEIGDAIATLLQNGELGALVERHLPGLAPAQSEWQAANPRSACHLQWRKSTAPCARNGGCDGHRADRRWAR